MSNPEEGSLTSASASAAAAAGDHVVARTTDWVSQTRRYRRNPGGLWWLALLGVPAILAALGLGGGTSDSDGVSMPSTSVSASAAPTEASPSASASVAAGPALGDLVLARAGDSIDVTATVPDEAARKALMGKLGALFPGATLVDKITVTAGATAPDVSGLAPVLASAGGGDFTLASSATGISLNGEVASDDVKSALAGAVAAAYPGVALTNGLTVKAAPAEPAADPCESLQKTINALTAKTKITFENGGTDLDAASVKLAAQVAAAWKTCPTAKLTVVGYTDNTGTASINKRLSGLRAEAVKKALVKAGIKDANVRSTGRGSANPVASNSTEAGRSKNRRVEIVVG